MRIVLPPLKPWQKDIYDKVANRGGSGKTFVLKSARQRGKSVLANALLVSYLLSNKCTCVVLEPTMAQSRRMFRQVQGWLEGSGAIESANATLLEMSFVNGSECLFKSAEMRDNLRGFTVSRSGILVIDEGAYVRDDIYEIIYPIVDACKAPMLVISTPLFRSGEFYKLYQQGLNPEFQNVETFDWMNGDYDMSDMLSAEKLEYYRKTMTRLKFQSEILGEFIDAGSFVFGDFTKCLGDLSRKPAVYAGIDWSAGNNDDGDYTVLTLLDEEARVSDIKYWRNFDSVDLVDAIATEIGMHPDLKSVQVELNSMGKVYRDLLKRKVRSGLVKDFVTTNESKRRVIEQLITAFQQGKITVPQDRELVKELQVYQIESTPTGMVTYNAPSGAHDDAVISLALAYDLVQKKAGQGKLRVRLV